MGVLRFPLGFFEFFEFFRIPSGFLFYISIVLTQYAISHHSNCLFFLEDYLAAFSHFRRTAGRKLYYSD